MNENNTEIPQQSQHGTEIALDVLYPNLADMPLEINSHSCGSNNHKNPNRYKQHGFHFNADNCIACHACESACSEKNDLAPHMAYRRVGAIEGGTYPDVTRINISMACNHCEDPVCLKGCPTRAYTKYLEYGAVLQDPEICFGCGYCTWVCPYNAPQLDTEKGQVQKCNMCIDRLEVGLQPACVDACLGNALDFGVIDEIPQKQQTADLTIPSFTDPSISRPNIRFQLNQSLPDEFHRIDDVPLSYHKENSKENYSDGKMDVSQSSYKIKAKGNPSKITWGLNKLRSREDPLVLFTLISQFVVGAFLFIFLFPLWREPAASLFSFQSHPVTMAGLMLSLIGLQTFALVLSTLHLGKPQYFYRAMNNLRHSWVSREIAAMGGFYGLLTAYSVVNIFPGLIAWLPEFISNPLPALFGWSASLLGPLAIYCMYRCYRIPARPFWDHWHSGGAFFSSGLILGSSIIGLVSATMGLLKDSDTRPLLSLFALFLLFGLIIQRVALYTHLRYLNKKGEEAAVSQMLMIEVFGKTTSARKISSIVLIILALWFSFFPPVSDSGFLVWILMTLLALMHEVIGRALFYVSVVPTTVPRAFFWGNQSFENLARKTGLAQRPQVGVLFEDH